MLTSFHWGVTYLNYKWFSAWYCFKTKCKLIQIDVIHCNVRDQITQDVLQMYSVKASLYLFGSEDVLCPLSVQEKTWSTQTAWETARAMWWLLLFHNENHNSLGFPRWDTLNNFNNCRFSTITFSVDCVIITFFISICLFLIAADHLCYWAS